MCVCVPPLPLSSHPYCGAEQQKGPPHPHMTPHPRPRIRTSKQLRDQPLGRTTPMGGVSRYFCKSIGVGGRLDLSDPTEIHPLLQDRCSNTPVALCFLWYRRLSLLRGHFFPLKWPIAVRRQAYRGGYR